MKSLVITGVFPPIVGGSGRWAWEIYRRLPRDEYCIVAGEHASAETFDESHDLNLRRMQLSLPDLGTFNPMGYLRYRRLVKSLCSLSKREAVAAVHCHALLPDAWIGRLVARQLGLPLLVTMHGEETCYADSSRQLDWMGRRILRDANLVVSNSHNTAEILRGRWNVENHRIRTLHPGVDCEKFVPATKDETVRQKLGWQGRTVVLTVGRLQARKGQDMLIRAVPQIALSVPDVLYAIAGDGEDYARLEKLARELGVSQYVRFYRQLDDPQLVQAYQQCDLFALPNRQIGADIEGFGMVLLEAQACGKPVIAGDSGGTAETMQVGETGDIIDCTSPHTMAAPLASILQNPQRRRQMAVKARAWVESQFSWPVLAGEACEVHGELIRSPHPA